MVAHSGGPHGDEMVSRMPNGSSSSSSASGATGGSGGVAKQALKKGPWTATEDAILIEYVKKNGEGNWNAVQKNTSLARCGKSCRLRWTNHLRPNLKKGSFTLEEERLILQLHAQLGNKWARMAAQLPGRTDNEIKNYWNTRIKRRIRQGLPLYPNDPAPQKQPTSSALQPQPQPVAAAAIRGRPPLQIPARTISQVLAQSHSPSPTLSPIPLSPQCNYSFTHSSSLFDPTTPLSPSTNGLLSPHSPTILSPSHILNGYHNPSDSFPGFLSAPQTSSLTLPTAIPFQFSPLNFNIYSPQGLQTTQSPGSVYTLLNPAELPSNQLFLSPVQKPVSKPEPEHQTNSKVSIPKSSSIELLEGLLEQAEVLTSNENLQRHSDLFNLQDAWDISVGSDNSSPEIGPGIKNEVKEENESVNVELSKLLQSIPSPANIPGEFNCLVDNLSMPSLDLGSGVVVTEDSLGLNIEQITSIFQADPASTDISRQAASCTWDNLPRMC